MNLTNQGTLYTPQKVLDRARLCGAHEECIQADEPGACTVCKNIIFKAFDFFYSKANNADEAFMMILSDIMEDQDRK